LLAISTCAATSGAPLKKLSEDKEAIASYVNDPLFKIADIRTKVGYEILQGFKKLKQRYGEVTTPLLVGLGRCGPGDTRLDHGFLC